MCHFKSTDFPYLIEIQSFFLCWRSHFGGWNKKNPFCDDSFKQDNCSLNKLASKQSLLKCVTWRALQWPIQTCHSHRHIYVCIPIYYKKLYILELYTHIDVYIHILETHSYTHIHIYVYIYILTFLSSWKDRRGIYIIPIILYTSICHNRNTGPMDPDHVLCRIKETLT